LGYYDVSSVGKKIQHQSMKKRILIVTPRSPFQGRGADELERLSGIKWFINNGFEVRVITKILKNDLEFIEEARNELKIKIIPVLYKFINKSSLSTKVKRLLNPLYWDGASYEYFDPETTETLVKELKDWGPGLVWFDFTYLWPLHSIVRKFNIPIITRSINYEPRHFIEEEGLSLKNIILYIPKFMTEYFASRSSDYLLALNPNETNKYKWFGAKKVVTLPLQALPSLLRKHDIRNVPTLNVLFMGSSYTVGHNKEALDFILRKVVPEISKGAPNKFVFHITGAKFPKEYEPFIDGKKILYDGYIPKEAMEEYFSKIDVMISPSEKRVGMQGKVFEPLARSIPLITSRQNIVGYPFYHKESVLLANTLEEYVSMLLYIFPHPVRLKLSKESKRICDELYSRRRIDSIMNSVLRDLNIS